MSLSIHPFPAQNDGNNKRVLTRRPCCFRILKSRCNTDSAYHPCLLPFHLRSHQLPPCRIHTPWPGRLEHLDSPWHHGRLHLARNQEAWMTWPSRKGEVSWPHFSSWPLDGHCMPAFHPCNVPCPLRPTRSTWKDDPGQCSSSAGQ